MTNHETGLLNPVPYELTQARSHYVSFRNAVKAEAQQMGDPRVIERRRKAAVHLVTQPEPPTEVGSWSSRIPLVGWWADGEKPTWNRALYGFNLAATVNHYAGQTVVRFVEGSYSDLASTAHRQPDVKLEIARVRPIPKTTSEEDEEPAEGKVHHFMDLLPSSKLPGEHRGAQIARYLAGFLVDDRQIISRTGKALFVKKPDADKNSEYLNAGGGVMSLEEDLNLYDAYKVERQHPLLFGNDAAFKAVTQLVGSVGGKPYKAFKRATAANTLSPTAPLPYLDFLLATQTASDTEVDILAAIANLIGPEKN